MKWNGVDRSLYLWIEEDHSPQEPAADRKIKQVLMGLVAYCIGRYEPASFAEVHHETFRATRNANIVPPPHSIHQRNQPLSTASTSGANHTTRTHTPSYHAEGFRLGLHDECELAELTALNVGGLDPLLETGLMDVSTAQQSVSEGFGVQELGEHFHLAG